MIDRSNISNTIYILDSGKIPNLKVCTVCSRFIQPAHCSTPEVGSTPTALPCRNAQGAHSRVSRYSRVSRHGSPSRSHTVLSSYSTVSVLCALSLTHQHHSCHTLRGTERSLRSAPTMLPQFPDWCSASPTIAGYHLPVKPYGCRARASIKPNHPCIHTRPRARQSYARPV